MSCNCGCNTCNIIKETKLLKEGTKYEPLISEALEFHIDNKIPLSENIFRIYSDGYFSLINEVRSLYNEKKIQLSESDEHLINTDIGKMGVYEGQLVPLDIPMVENLNEAEYKGKDVDLNKPKRGGSKAYYVYVKDPKTKKVKKVSFGSGGLRAKIKNKKARTAFAKRHNCDKKKDRTKAGYWSCNLPRYAKSLGLGSNMNTYW
jgi:hypothetical protein